MSETLKEILYLLFMSSTSVVVLFIIARLLGKRQISQLDFMDYKLVYLLVLSRQKWRQILVINRGHIILLLL